MSTSRQQCAFQQTGPAPYTNTTTVTDDYASGAPYTRPFNATPCYGEPLPACATATPCDGTGQPKCAPWKISDRPDVTGWNTYSGPGTAVKACACGPGVKQVIARQSWYGRPSFAAPCLDQTADRYRTATTDATAYWVNAFVYDAGGYASADPAHEGSLTIHRKYTVNKSSGVIESTGNTDTETGEAFAGACDSGPDALTGIANLLELVCNGELIPQDCATIYADPMDDPLTNCGGYGENCLIECITNEISEDGLTYSLEYTFWQLYETTTANPDYDPDGDCRQYLWDYVEQGSVSFTVTLSDAYTKAELNSEVDGLIDSILLNDDDKFPWQNTVTPAMCPMVTRMQRLAGVAPPFYNELSWVDAGADCYHGGIIGVMKPAGYNGYFNFDYWTHGCCGELPDHYYAGAGASSTSFEIPVNSTHWTQIDYPWVTTLPSAGGGHVFDGVTLTKMKMAMTALSVPAVRFGRGGLDRYQPDETKTVCIASFSSPTITTDGSAGTLAAAPCYVKTTGIDGIYSVTGSGTSYTMDSLTPLYATPDSIDYAAGSGILAPLRFPDALPILGKAKATATIDEAGELVTVTTANKLWLRSGDRIALDGTTMDYWLISGPITRTGDYTFTIATTAGTTLDGFTGFIFSTDGAFTLDWQTGRRRGTAVFVEKTAEGVDREQVTFDPANCGTVFCISDTAGDTWPSMVKRPLPPLIAGSFGQSMFHLFQVDPFFQIPHATCVDDAASHCTLTPDYAPTAGACIADTCADGAGIRRYPYPLREALLTVPKGAPALPDGISLDVEQYNLPSLVTLDCAGIIPIKTPWGLWSAMKDAACDISCRFADYYKTEGGFKCA